MRTTTQTAQVHIQTGDAALTADVGYPAAAAAPAGVVVFAHGSGSSRHSPRNRAVAAALRRHGLATLLADLLTAAEEEADVRGGGHLRFDIDLLARRVAGILDWLPGQPRLGPLPVALFGASTGAAAALVAAAERPARVRAVVSRGGRPDLAGAALARVRAPTLLIVGGADTAVLALNEEASRKLGGPWALHVVDGATHLFEEPGALAEVAEVAAAWLGDRLAPTAGS
ncbi:MAG TPA: alpha/beta fold hydrolase [Pilimelia sp.]|nr:alpha/beta fold hydrolase [Pilimelia sp.]